MDFTDDAFVLGARPHGETGAIVHVLTREYGIYAAHIAGGASRRLKPLLQPGSYVEFAYRARSSDQLGSATVEPAGPTVHGADIFDDPLALLGLQCACVLTKAILPEREPHEGAFYGFQALRAAFSNTDIWPAVYVRFEAGLLEALGFGLDLSACAVTGVRDQLTYVSPKSGRAVCLEAGEPYKDKLLPLPQFMLSAQMGLREGDIGRGLDLTGYFLERHLFHPANKPLPEVRIRLRTGFP